MSKIRRNFKLILPTIISFLFVLPVYAQQHNLSNIYQNVLSTQTVKEETEVEPSFDLQLERAKEGLAILLSDLEQDITRGKDTTIRKKAISAQLKAIEAIEKETKKLQKPLHKAPTAIPLFTPPRKDISWEEIKNQTQQILTSEDVHKIEELKQKLPAKAIPSFPIYHKIDTELFPKGKGIERVPAILPREVSSREVSLRRVSNWELAGVSKAPTPLATAPEIQITQEIRDLAARLNNDYQQIFNWVQRNIDFQPYLGCAKGSILTLWDRAGNSADINALFCALLQAAGYTTDYIDADIIIPLAKAPDLAGVPDIIDAFNILYTHGLIEGTIGNPATHLIILHFYTKVTIGTQTIYLDPSFKTYEFTPGIDVPYQTFDEAGYLSNEKSYLPVDRHVMDIEGWLSQNYPDSATDDIYIKATVSTTQAPQPPLPYSIYQIWGTYTAIPDWAMHRVGIKAVYRYPDNSELTIINRGVYNLCELAGKRVSLISAPYLTNYYIPKIAVDGTVTQAGLYYFDPGVSLRWIIDFKSLGHWGNGTCTHPWVTGATAVISLSPQAVSDRLIQERQAILTANRGNPQVALEELLHLIVLGYFKDVDTSYHKACGLNHYPHTRATFEAMGIQWIRVDGNKVIPTSMAIDVLRTPQYVFDVDNVANLWAMLGWQGSGEEHAIWEKLLEIPSISTTKGMQVAHQRHYTIYEVNSSNINTLLPLINIPQYKKDHIKKLINNGNVVTIPDREFYYNDWFGTIFLIEGGEDSGYIIWGATQQIINGGQTTVDPTQKDTTLGKDTGKQTTKDDPIDMATGNLDISATDIFIPNKIPLGLKRAYQSRSFRTSPFGWGWHYTYGLKLWQTPDATILISGPEGQLWRFTPTPSGYTPSPGIHSTLSKIPSGYTLREKTGTIYSFDNQGNLTTITDRFGNQLTLTRNIEGNLTQVQDSAGRSLNFEYTNNRITKVTDPSGRQFLYTYSYDPNDLLIGMTDPDGKSTVYTYSGDHNLLTQTDPNDNLTMWLYYDQDRVYKRIGADAGELTLKYNTKDSKTTFIDSLGKTTLFYYNTLGVVTKEVDLYGKQILSTYDSNLNLTAKTDKNNRTTNMSYDAMGNTLSITDPKAKTTYFTYESTYNQVTSIADPVSNKTTFEYDASGNLIKVTDPLNNPTIYTYDSHGNTLSMKDAKGNTTQYTYDAYNNLLTITAPNSAKTIFTYEILGNRLSMTDANSNQTKYTYDNLTRLTKITYPDNSTTEYSYDGVGNRLTMKDPNGNITTYTYDKSNRLIKITDPLSNATQYTYDTEGNRTSLTDAQGNTTNYSYDSLNRLIQVKAPNNTTTNFGYDAVGNRLSMTDGNNNATNYAYDELNRLAQVTDAVANPTKYEYDAIGNLTKITDANNHATTYNYDGLSRLTKVVDPLNNTTAYSYDAVGNLLSKADANGTTTAYTYDAVNRLEEVAVVGTGLVPVHYGYDVVGNLLEMTDTHGKTTYNYNSLNRLTQETPPNGLVLKYEYDAVGNRIKVIDPWNRVIAYQYDGVNRLAQVTDPQSKVTTYAYNKVGAPMEVNYPNGVKTTNSYDNLNRLTLLKTQGSVLINQFAYGYDNVGNRLTMTDKDGGVTRYEYDKLYRLTKASYPSTSATTYTYDPVGNRLTMNGISYTYDVADRLLQAGATTYGYDANGNMISKTETGETTNYTYDYANRLISIRNSQSEIRNSYDGYGRRISRLSKGSGFGIPEAQFTEYLWDGTNVLCEFYQNKGNPVEYIYGNGQMISRDDLLVLPVSKRLVYQNSHWFHQDGLGSVVNLTDNAGNTKLTYDYDAFGEITKEQGQVGWKKNRYAFTGKPYDPASGMYYFGARYYDSQVGRFVSKDSWTFAPDDAKLTNPEHYIYPIILISKNKIISQGQIDPRLLHKYMYCLNNPVIYVDEWGNFITWWGWAGVILVPAGIGIIAIGHPWIGYPMVVVGIGCATGEYVAGWYDAQEIGRETGKAIWEKKIENGGGLSAKELQEMGIIGTNDQLKVGGLTNEDLRELGLK